jgi:hypothetical protein
MYNTLSIPALAMLLLAVASAQTSGAPSGDEVVARMMAFDAQRQAQMTGYTAIRRYVAVNKKRRAEMVVRVECSAEGVKQFTILAEEGSGAVRQHVLRKLVDEETEASQRGTRSGTRLTPENYEFQLLGEETLDSGPAYVLFVTPKTRSKYLIDGKIWVNKNDYSIVRIDGRPAKNPSFWVHDVHIVHTYQKIGYLWFASATRTTSEVRMFGPSELTIENSDYVLTPSTNRDRLARLMR